MDEAVTENLRQLRDKVDRLFVEAQAKLREAQAANSEYRTARMSAYLTKESNDIEET